MNGKIQVSDSQCHCVTLKGKLNTGIREVPIEGDGFNYQNAINKPSINNVELTSGNHTLDELGIPSKDSFVQSNVQGEKGLSGIYNSETGGQLVFNTNDNKIANVSTNDGEANIYVQLSVTDKTTKEGARITLDTNKAYYTSSNTYTFDDNDEIMTKKDLPNLDNVVTKDTTELEHYYKKSEMDTKLNDKADKTEIPSTDGFIKKDADNLDNYYDKTSIDNKIENFITKSVDDLTNYYKKSETYTQDEVNQRISAIKTGSFKNVDQLPESGEENIIYLVPAKKTFANNTKDEYIWLTDDQKFEQIGSTQLDLDGYVTDEILTQKLQEYVTTTALEEKLQEYAKTSQIPDTSDFITETEVDAKLLNKADKSEIPSLDNYYTKEETYSNTEIDEKIKEASGTDLSAYLKKEEASETYLDKTTASETYATKGEIPDTKDFITETTADGKYASKDEIANFITENAVDTKLEDYYTKQDIDGKGYLTEHQDLTDYMKTADADLKYATKQEIPSLDGYAKTEDIAKEYATKTEISDFITESSVDTKLEDYVTNQALEEKHYLTEHQDISKLATKEEVNLKADKTDLDNYTDTQTLERTYATKTEIPDTKSFITKDVTDLTNYYDKDTIDSKTADFITKTVEDLTNYYKKNETYNQTEIDQKISTVISGGFKRVEQLPDTGESKYIYLVPADKSFSQNIKNEFIWLDDEQAFEQIGSTQLDLEPYATTEALNQKLQDYVTTTTLEQKLADYDKSTQVDSKIDEETRDLLKTLSRELKPDEEDESGYSAQTLVNVKNKSDATELILEIDNLDVKTNVAVNSVLGTLKGQDLEDRLKVVESAGYITKEVSDLTNYYDQTTIDSKLDTKQPTGNYALKTDIPTATSKLSNDSGFITNEVDDLANYYDKATIDGKQIPVIEKEATISEEELKAHTFPQLTLDNDQIQTVIKNNVSILKVKYSVTKLSGTETDTMVFYTTLDNVENGNSGAVAKTIKINAIRTNDEGDIIYHGELLGKDDTFATSLPLTATYIEHIGKKEVEALITGALEASY